MLFSLLKILANSKYFITNLQVSHTSKKLKQKGFIKDPVICYSKLQLLLPSTHPLRPIITDNACHSCITAAAGTCIGHGFCSSLIIIPTCGKSFTALLAFFTYISLLSHAFAYCSIFFTAAWGWKAVLIPFVADSSLKSTRDNWLVY